MTKKTNSVGRIALIVLGIALWGFGLTLMNVRDNITVFAGVVCVIAGIGLAASIGYSVMKEKIDQ